MVATADFSSTVFFPDVTAEPAPPAVLTAHVLADVYLRYVSALWRGDAAAQGFEIWLHRHWCVHLPPVPTMPPTVVSPHGGAGSGIRWYELSEEIVGYVTGAVGGYRVPVDAVPPTLG